LKLETVAADTTSSRDIGAYSLNNEIRVRFRVRVKVRVRVWIVCYMDAQTAARFGSTDP